MTKCDSTNPDHSVKFKDTLNNIKTVKEFSVNIISEHFVEAAKLVTFFLNGPLLKTPCSFCSIDAPPEVVSCFYFLAR